MSAHDDPRVWFRVRAGHAAARLGVDLVVRTTTDPARDVVLGTVTVGSARDDGTVWLGVTPGAGVEFIDPPELDGYGLPTR